MLEPGRQPPPQDDVKAIPPKNETHSDTQISQEPATLVDAVVPSPPTQKKSCYCRPAPTPWWKTLCQVTEALCAVSLVGITFYYTRAAFRQACASENAANAATSAAKTAAATLLDQQKSFIIQQRPYMVTEQPVFMQPPVAGIPMIAKIKFKNIGKTPAYSVIPDLTMVSWKGKQSDLNAFLGRTIETLRKQTSENSKKFVMVDEDVPPEGLQYGENPKAVTLSQEEVSNFSSLKTNLIYAGFVDYRDSFGNPYETVFCYYYTGVDPSVWHIYYRFNTIR